MPIKSPVRPDTDLSFDAAPLVLRKGRLHIPNQLMEDYVDDDDTSDDAARLLADHASVFLSDDSEYTMARLELAKQGMSGGKQSSDSGVASVTLRSVQPREDDPKDTYIRCAGGCFR